MEAERLSSAVDTVHRVGAKNPNRRGGITLQFSSRILRAAVWNAAKKSAFLKEKGLRFGEDLCKVDRETRMKLWPLVVQARKEGKVAYSMGDCAFIDKKEIFPPA